MTDLNALAIFAKVVEAGSFSAAGRQLGMPVSSVSRRIRNLEDQLGVRLLERSTRHLRITDVGADILEQAQHSVELGEAIDLLLSNQSSNVSGLVRLSAPPSISDTLLAPIAGAFQASYPNVRIQALVTERRVDHITDGVDLAFRVGHLKDSTLVARRLLTYRRRLVASADYLKNRVPPVTPMDLLQHRLVCFSHATPHTTWEFVRANGADEEVLTFNPNLCMNDHAGLVPVLLGSGGIGDLPPVVQPEMISRGLLVEVMPEWHFKTFDLSLVHLGNRNMSKPVRLFMEFALNMAPKLFPDLPT